MTAPRERIDPVGLRRLDDHLPYQPLGGMRHRTYSPAGLIVRLLLTSASKNRVTSAANNAGYGTATRDWNSDRG
jgi:hypothetical protein